MKFSGGLAALILILSFNLNLFAVEYLYKDEVLNNPQFREDVNTLGSELFEKTGISLRIIMIKKLPNGMHLADYEKGVIQSFNEPTILLSFAELDSKVDILANDPSLYKYFDKKQVLSPVASVVQSLFMAVFFSKDFETFKDMAGNYGGTIIPLLAEKTKEEKDTLGKYAGAMYNGYDDIAEQIASSKGVTLEHAAGDSNKITITFIKLFFYGFILYGIYMYLKRKLYLKRHKLEK